MTIYPLYPVPQDLSEPAGKALRDWGLPPTTTKREVLHYDRWIAGESPDEIAMEPYLIRNPRRFW